MKKLLIIICLIFFSGCQRIDWAKFSEGINEYSRQHQETVRQHNLIHQENAREINRQLQKESKPLYPPNYWQERQAEQQYWDDYYRKMGIRR